MLHTGHPDGPDPPDPTHPCHTSPPALHVIPPGLLISSLKKNSAAPFYSARLLVTGSARPLTTAFSGALQCRGAASAPIPRCSQDSTSSLSSARLLAPRSTRPLAGAFSGALKRRSAASARLMPLLTVPSRSRRRRLCHQSPRVRLHGRPRALRPHPAHASMHICAAARAATSILVPKHPFAVRGATAVPHQV